MDEVGEAITEVSFTGKGREEGVRGQPWEEGREGRPSFEGSRGRQAKAIAMVVGRRRRGVQRRQMNIRQVQ